MKTYVLDSSALVVYLQRKTSGEKVSQLLQESNRGHAATMMSAVNYGEVYGSILRAYGADRAISILSTVRLLPLELVDVTPDRAVQAADIKARYRLYYADSFAAALALESKATLVSSDSDFRKLGHGFPILWLKN